ncbi:MAG: LptF/LptG family permease [Candidatus Omnitrophota bacterium]
MKILRTYILKDFLSSFFFSIMSLTLVMMLGNLIKISDMIIRKGVNVIDAFKLFSFFIPYILGFTIPLSILMGTLLVMGRFAADNELVAINVAGISFFRILNIFLTIGLISSLFLFILKDKVLPDFHYNYRWHIKNIYAKNITAIIEPGVYLENFKDTILYVEDIKENKLKNIFIYEIYNEELNQVTFAKTGEFAVDNNVLKMKLENGFSDRVNAKDKTESYRASFSVLFQDLPIEGKDNVTVDKKPADMNIQELKKEIRRFRKLDIDPIKFLLEIHERISFSFAPLTFVLLGFGISLVVKHREKSINFGVAALIAGIYYILILLGETLSSYHYIPPLLGMWFPNIIVSALGMYLFMKYAYIR